MELMDAGRLLSSRSPSATSTSRSSCRSKTCSRSPVVAPSSPARSSRVRSTPATKLRSSVCVTRRRPPAPASRCSARSSTRATPATTSARCSAVPRRKKSSAARCCASPARSRRTPSSRAQIYVLSKEEGGRHSPFFNNYRPQFFFRTTDVTGSISAARGHRDGHAGRQHHHQGGARQADRHGRGSSLRYS